MYAKETKNGQEQGTMGTRVLAVVLVANWVCKGLNGESKPMLSQTLSYAAKMHFSAGGCGQQVEKALNIKEWV